jgi:type IV pilus assembly protein PilC
MPHYQYEGITQTGKQVAGTIEAVNETEVKSSLRKTRVRVTAVKEKQSAHLSGFLGRVRLKDVSAFTRQFASMNSAAIPLVDCLESIGEQTENTTLRGAVRTITSDVQAGTSLAEALSRHPEIFNRLYCSMVRAGEAAGILPNVLLRLADYQEKAVGMRRRVKSAFAYPVLVGVVAVGALVALLTFVVPTFASMLTELGAQLPLSTRFVIGASEFVKIWLLPAVGIATGVVIAVVYLYKRNAAARMLMDSVCLRLPLFGDLQKKSAVSRFSRTFGALLNGGVPIADALEITSTTAGNRVLEQGFLKTLEAIRSGQPLAAPLKATGVFPPMVIQMINVGEKSGQLPGMLVKIADYYDTEVDSAITTLTSLLEPALIVIMGILIAGVLIAMYLPMFEMVSSIG